MEDNDSFTTSINIDIAEGLCREDRVEEPQHPLREDASLSQ